MAKLGHFLVVSALMLMPGAATARPSEAPASVEVDGPRMSFADVVPRLHGAPPVDLGPAPAPGASRVLTRDDLVAAFRRAGTPIPKGLPAVVRVVRRMRTLRREDQEALLREALRADSLPRGVSLSAVRPLTAADVPAGWDSVQLEMPRPPRRGGAHQVRASLVMRRLGEEIARLSVPVELLVDPEKAMPDVARGGALVVVLSRGGIEITAPASALSDADIGDVLPVSVRGTSYRLRAKLVTKDRAVLLEGADAR